MIADRAMLESCDIPSKGNWEMWISEDSDLNSFSSLGQAEDELMSSRSKVGGEEKRAGQADDSTPAQTSLQSTGSAPLFQRDKAPQRECTLIGVLGIY